MGGEINICLEIGCGLIMFNEQTELIFQERPFGPSNSWKDKAHSHESNILFDKFSFLEIRVH